MLELPLKVSSVEMEEGEGARVKRLFPTPHKEHCDPFVLMDEFFLDEKASFPNHHHRGFESITYLFRGSVRHRDSLGNDCVLTPGASQAFVTGKGVNHSEVPQSSEITHGIQLWVNLPKKDKLIEPHYSQFDPSRIPEERWKGKTVRTICGPSSPIRLKTPIIFQDVTLQAGYSHQTSSHAEYSGLIYSVQGLLKIKGESLMSGEGIFWQASEAIQITAAEEAHFIVLFGLPHHERIRINGTCVD